MDKSPNCEAREKAMRIGIMSTMQEENKLLQSRLENPKEISIGNRLYLKGDWLGHEVVVAFSRWGKVAAAITATHLINQFQVDALVFMGAAGGCDSEVSIGDIVIASDLVQHDMNAQPIFARHEIPLIGVSNFQVNQLWQDHAYEAACGFIEGAFQKMDKNILKIFDISNPKVHVGCIATGDQFFASEKDINELKTHLPEALCVEMEGAAVAQVCYEHQIPYLVIRTISDSARKDSSIDFSNFISLVSSEYSLEILKHLLPRLSN